MQGVCESVVRCLCSCLINKTQVQYTDTNEDHHEFIKLGDQPEDDQRPNLQQKEYVGNPNRSPAVNRILNFMEEDKKDNSSLSPAANKLINFIKEDQRGKDKTTDVEAQQLISDSAANTMAKESALMELKKESSNKYRDVIAQDHPYFSLFKQKLVELEAIFQVPPGAYSAEPEVSYPLRMHCYQEGGINNFKYFFRLPTDYHTYEAISNDFELQRQFDPNIEEFRKVLETPGGDAKLIYLSYKKVLIMSSRDFEYVRYSFKKDDEYWSICISDMSREKVNSKVRGEMLLTATKIVEHAGEIEVSVSSTTDMKMPIKLQIAKNRGFAEIRKYLDRVYNYIKEEEGKSII